jgi:hypothetical protein
MGTFAVWPRGSRHADHRFDSEDRDCPVTRRDLADLVGDTEFGKGVWDANDTRGRLDIRWVGARYTSTGELRATIVLYRDFRRWAPPIKENLYGRFGLIFTFGRSYDGIFYRHHGHIKVSYGDHASGCCEVRTVRRPSRTTLVALIRDPWPFGAPPDDVATQVSGRSSFWLDGEARTDQTATFRLRR